LDGWPGTLIVVSHDRYLLERVADRQVALLGDGQVRDLPGGVEQYLELRRAALAGAGAASTGFAPTGGDATAGDGETGGAAPAGPSAAGVRAAKKEINRIERRLSKIAEAEARLHERIAANATDFAAVAELDAELRTLAAEKDELEAAWLEAAEVAG